MAANLTETRQLRKNKLQYTNTSALSIPFTVNVRRYDNITEPSLKSKRRAVIPGSNRDMKPGRSYQQPYMQSTRPPKKLRLQRCLAICPSVHMSILPSKLLLNHI